MHTMFYRFNACQLLLFVNSARSGFKIVLQMLTQLKETLACDANCNCSIHVDVILGAARQISSCNADSQAEPTKD